MTLCSPRRCRHRRGTQWERGGNLTLGLARLALLTGGEHRENDQMHSEHAAAPVTKRTTNAYIHDGASVS